ncbi:putative isoprenylcysteine alpha-carbonyl methylesterase ICMEL1 [Hibiscus syriacus]|uniref:protein-S-isoprenylcysteine alpha-carbonyl methylesterase n=1 Tax=Hibiscus syriacus TaxID=106335 RepID=A0A6A3AYL1_HIBSY|nr:putative isoprenylcysteine alpha-carbonyl methylesterase ICMEL1 [Hibiscus syriacus]
MEVEVATPPQLVPISGQEQKCVGNVFRCSFIAGEKKLICVTSGNSYLGSCVVKELLSHAMELEELKDVVGEEELNLLESVVITKMGDLQSLCDAFRGCHAVFHTSSFIDPHGISGYSVPRLHLCNLRYLPATAVPPETGKYGEANVFYPGHRPCGRRDLSYYAAYLHSPQISRGRLPVVYKISCSCLLCFASYAWFSSRLDLYLPANSNGPKPVVVFVTGGAWIIGYKAWGSLLGLQLVERDVIVACIDYRNFPQGTISDMVKDVSQGVSFVCNLIGRYGGDPNRIYLMGQSAGAHISACVLLEQAIKESRGESTTWSVSQIKSYFGLSGGTMEGEESFEQFSPEVRIKNPGNREAASLLPHVKLFHGTSDLSIPSDASINLVEALKGAGAEAEVILYDGKSHTDLFLQDPLRGGKDDLFDHMVSVIHASDEEALAKDALAPPRKRLVPEILLRLAHHISPF